MIPDPINNNNDLAYKECELCDNSTSYYCINSNKEACIKIDIKNYFPNDLDAKQNVNQNMIIAYHVMKLNV